MLGAVQAMSVVLLLIMALILGNTLAIATRERGAEYAALQAIGFRPRQIVLSIVGEGLVLSLASGVLGVALAVPFIQAGVAPWVRDNFAQFMPSFRIESGVWLQCLVVLLLLPSIAAIPSALGVMRSEVSTALRQVE